MTNLKMTSGAIADISITDFMNEFNRVTNHLKNSPES